MRIHELFQAMSKHNASDLHLKLGEPPIFRVNGELVRIKSPPLQADDVETIRELRARNPVPRLGPQDRFSPDPQPSARRGVPASARRKRRQKARPLAGSNWQLPCGTRRTRPA